MSKREQILDAIMAAQTGVSGINAANIFRSRVAAVAREEGRTLIITAQRDAFDQIVMDRVERRLLVALTITERSGIPDEQCDASISSVYEKMMADVTLGGKCIDVTPGDITFDYGDADQPALVVTLFFEIYYRHIMTSLDS